MFQQAETRVLNKHKQATIKEVSMNGKLTTSHSKIGWKKGSMSEGGEGNLIHKNNLFLIKNIFPLLLFSSILCFLELSERLFPGLHFGRVNPIVLLLFVFFCWNFWLKGRLKFKRACWIKARNDLDIITLKLAICADTWRIFMAK